MPDDDAALHGQADGQADRQADRQTGRQTDRRYGSRCWHVSAQKGKSETLTAYGNTVRWIHQYAGTMVQWLTRRTGAPAHRHTGTQEHRALVVQYTLQCSY